MRANGNEMPTAHGTGASAPTQFARMQYNVSLEQRASFA